MSKSPSSPAIRLRGVRHNNLKNFDLDLPVGKLIVVTGLSGSGKSSLAFDTLYAEGQRRYIETFSPYARQFFDRMDKPQVDRIEGIPPAIAIEQRNTVKTTRSTVGTMTEICDYMKVAWAHLSRLHCRQCGQPVRKDSPQQIWESLGFSRGTEGGSSSMPMAPAELRHPGNSAAEAIVAFVLPLTEKLTLADSLALIARQGYQRLLLPKTGRRDGGSGMILREVAAPFGTAIQSPGELEVIRVDEAAERLGETRPGSLTIIQDRVKLAPSNRSRFVEACEQAYHFGKGKLVVYRLVSGEGTTDPVIGSGRSYSQRLHCAACDLDYREPTPALFSFNNPVGACPTCRGFGRTITIDYNLAIPDRSLSLKDGAVKPWQSGQGAECQADLAKFCRHRGIPMNVPFHQMKPEWQEWVINGDADYGKDEEHEWPRAWYGVKGYFRWLESKAYKMHVRVLLSRYRAYRTCADCNGRRFQPEALLFQVEQPNDQGNLGGARRIGKTARRENGVDPITASGARADGSLSRKLTLADFYQLPVTRALALIDDLSASLGKRKANDPLSLVLGEVRSRLGYLEEVGLGYLTLDRPTRSLSGGETERVSLTTCLGSRLVNTLFVLDEPSVGLHARDTRRLVGILERLRDAGNTVLVVEHEAALMRAADEIVDLGPGHGKAGGSVVFQGPFKEILKSTGSLTGRYLSGKERGDPPPRRPVTKAAPALTMAHANTHNLRDLTVEIPLGRLVCVTGVSGSGKTTLVREVLLPLLASKLQMQLLKPAAQRSDAENDVDTDESGDGVAGEMPLASLSGWENLGRVVLVDQSPLGRTPRSNPAVYSGAFDDIREIFAQSDLARQRGLNASAFSFNSSQGQCETCRGAGFEKIEMQFLSDVFIRCPECQGRRDRPHILEVIIRDGRQPSASTPVAASGRRARVAPTGKGWSIADCLDATVDEAIVFLEGFEDSRPARRAIGALRLLQEVGLGYLGLGQPINTLSGGESQRLKLVSHLVEFQQAEALRRKPTLFLFDEPTTGLHFDDVRVLLRVFQRLVDAGHSVLIIEHNLDVMRAADWLIDLGPEAGEGGGNLVIAGTPDTVARESASHTGAALRAPGV